MRQTKLSVVLICACVVKCFAMSYNELEDFADYLKKTSQLSPTLKKGAEPDDYDEDEIVSDNAWEESGKFEGDLILNERQRRLIVENVAEGLSRNGISDGTKRWPNNEVIYYIQVEHFTGDQVQAIQNGIDDLAQASCIKFRPYRKGDRNAVVIQGNRRGCFSQVGYQGGYQVLNLSGRHPIGRGCFRHGTVVHELLHSLGFYHMQSSPDRDDYVSIIWENIVQPAKHNFRKYNSFSVSDFGVGYDYDSVLHYSRRAFSSNGQDTIVPKKVGAQIGQRAGLSEKDTLKLNKMYCDADSDLIEADDDSTKKTPKKKNKPFNGQGLGYHQGKAVVIKLLPAADTKKIPEVPGSHVFDYFSKTPQILPTSQSEDFGFGKEIASSYNPNGLFITENYKEPINYNTELKLLPRDEEESQSQPQIYDDDSELKDLNHANIKNSNIGNIEVASAKPLSNAHEDIHDPSIIETFDRVSKIIQSHVYPSQTPDLNIHKMHGRQSEREKKPEQVKTEIFKADYLATIVDPTAHTEKTKSAISAINNLFDISSFQSFKTPENIYHPKTTTNENYFNSGRQENVHNKKSVIPSFKYADESTESSPFSLLQQYQDDYTKYSKSRDAGNSYENQDGWHYKPYNYRPDSYDAGISYDANIPKNNSEEDDFGRSHIYSLSVPKEFSYHDPFQSDKSKIR